MAHMIKNLGAKPLVARQVFLTALVFGLSAVFAPALASPRIPTQPSEVLERLPMRPTDTTARLLSALRAEVSQSAATKPGDPQAAIRLAEQYFELAMARGDPRYVGYADAVIRPFVQTNSAPLWAIRGQLLQYRHGFEAALSSFESALKVDPDFASAHAWLAQSVRRFIAWDDRHCRALARGWWTPTAGAWRRPLAIFSRHSRPPTIPETGFGC